MNKDRAFISVFRDDFQWWLDGAAGDDCRADLLAQYTGTQAVRSLKIIFKQTLRRYQQDQNVVVPPAGFEPTTP